MIGASILFVVLAAFFWGLAGGIGAMLMADGWGPFVVSFYRAAIGLLFVFVWLSLRPRNSGLTSFKVWFWSAVAGLGFAGNFSFYFLSISHGSIAVAATLMYCAPVFVYLVSFALKLERPTATKWGAIVLVMVGIGFLTQIHDIEASGLSFISVGAGLLAGLSYALFIFGFKYAVPHGSPPAILSIAFLVAAIALIWPATAEQLLEVTRSEKWPLFLSLGVFGAGISFVFYIIGLKNTLPSIA